MNLLNNQIRNKAERNFRFLYPYASSPHNLLDTIPTLLVLGL
jgi:hypothetical protein